MSMGMHSYVENCLIHNKNWIEMVPNYEMGLRTAQWSEKMNVNPDELGDYFEGDIMATDTTKRSALIDDREYVRWPDGVIPIVINGDFNAKRKLEKAELKTINDFDLPYDYDSIMHYSAYVGAVNNHVKTIIPLKDQNAEIGQRKRLSDLDIMKINLMFNCSSMSYCSII
ncbi:PREDICTED: zinc metalloproteinase nas-7-like [Cyphomyrmex costatus]|uniref:zinc metalloproteinase nas-7-like n=1 Tax=Cyphomyrmex costatus TaxID=456900 RepID=UPI0008522476|nr:PREDICTED: zinc metalloproteinase nas-7-like [Cyphomyrmex costatus]